MAGSILTAVHSLWIEEFSPGLTENDSLPLKPIWWRLGEKAERLKRKVLSAASLRAGEWWADR